MRKFKLLQLLLSASIILFACKTQPTVNASDRIESSAKKTYVFRTYLKDDAITIKTSADSVVTLTGTVSDWSHRLLAEQTIAELPGVKRIENRLEATNGQPEENSDAWIGMKIKTMLMFHRNVSGIKTTVDVNGGVVTLSGKASSEAQKELTNEYVKDINGVTSVKNEMVIDDKDTSFVEKVGDNIDDISITTQVKTGLLLHRSTSILKTKVTTEKGVVTVSGKVKNSAEKDLVGKIVNDIKGVNGLINELTIE